MLFRSGMHELARQRQHLRKQFVEGRSLKKVPFENDKWYRENDVKLLDLHCQCDPEKALDDAFYMVCSEIPRISVNERKKRVAENVDEEAPKKRAKLDPCEPQIISDWYDKKDAELAAGADGDAYKKEREKRENRVRQQVEREQQVATT